MGNENKGEANPNNNSSNSQQQQQSGITVTTTTNNQNRTTATSASPEPSHPHQQHHHADPSASPLAQAAPATPSSSLPAFSPSNSHLRRALANDEEVVFLLDQLSKIPLQPPILRSTGAPPEKEIELLVSSFEDSPTSFENPKNQQQTGGETENKNDKNDNEGGGFFSSPTLSALSPFLADLKRRAISATSTNNPGFVQRTTEVGKMQKGVFAIPKTNQFLSIAGESGNTSSSQNSQHQLLASSSATTTITPSSSSAPQSPAPLSLPVSGDSPSVTSLSTNSNANIINSTMSFLQQSYIQQQQQPLPSIAVGTLLQTLGRTQTMCTREVSRSTTRCEKMITDARALTVEINSLRNAALEQLRIGQKCYGLEHEVKRLHLELNGNSKETAESRSLGHDGVFSSLNELSDDVVDLLKQVDAFIVPEARDVLHEHARHIEMKLASPNSAMRSPITSKKQ